MRAEINKKSSTIPLYPYQKEGARFLVEHRANKRLLGDEQGLGKTAQVIRAIDVLFNRGDDRPALIICPAIAKTNWKREFKKFALCDREALVINDSKKLRAVITKYQKDVNSESFVLKSPIETPHFIVSYDLAVKLSRELNLKVNGPPKPKRTFSVVVFDEIHYLKNRRAKRTQWIFGNKKLCRHAGLIAWGARQWGLSGTLMPNHAGELWTLFFVFGATTRDYNSFIKQYCDSHKKTVQSRHGRIYTPTVITGTKRSEIPNLRKLLKRIVLRRTLESVSISLPPLRFGSISIERPESVPEDLLSKEDVEKAIQLETYLGAHFAPAGSLTFESLALVAKSVSTLRRYIGAMKVEFTTSLVTDELEQEAYPKIVIFTIHQSVTEGLERRLWKFCPVSIFGKTPSNLRQVKIDRFQSDPTCQILIANIGTAGTAINLTASNHVLFAEQDWVPGNNAQALKRCHRIGQNRSVLVRTVSIENSLDDRITEVLTRKTEEIALTFNELNR